MDQGHSSLQALEQVRQQKGGATLMHAKALRLFLTPPFSVQVLAFHHDRDILCEVSYSEVDPLPHLRMFQVFEIFFVDGRYVFCKSRPPK
jgi:hypothetical protein